MIIADCVYLVNTKCVGCPRVYRYTCELSLSTAVCEKGEMESPRVVSFPAWEKRGELELVYVCY